jgi:hypothetical protein
MGVSAGYSDLCPLYVATLNPALMARSGPACAPVLGVLEEFEPGAGAVSLEGGGGGVPGVLPHEETPLRVRHDCQVAAVRGAEGRDAGGRAVGVGGVGLRHVLLGVAVPAKTDRCHLPEYLLKRQP